MDSAHSEPTHQGTVGAFALEKISLEKPRHVFSAIYLSHLVGSPYLWSTNQVAGTDFGLRQITSYNPPDLFFQQRFQSDPKMKSDSCEILKEGFMISLVPSYYLVAVVIIRFLPHYGVWKLSGI